MSQSDLPHSYFGYGLRINSRIALTELPPPPQADGAPDVRVTLGDLSSFNYDREQTTVLAARRNELAKNWARVGVFAARGGCEIVVDPDPRAQIASLSPFVTGPMMACLLHQRGFLVLHASAVLLQNKGIGFLADSGEGKSTLAAFLAVRGAALAADDVVPIRFTAAGAETVPGYPQIRLWTDSLDSIGVDYAGLSKVNEFIDKRFLPAERENRPETIKLRALYVISEAGTPEIVRCSPSEAFFAVARHSYLRRHIEATGENAQHFENCRRLVAAVPVFHLRRPRVFDALPAVAEALGDHLLTLDETGSRAPKKRA